MEKLLFEGDRAVGVLLSHDTDGSPAHEVKVKDGGEVLVCTGAVQTPALLQRSGVGPAALLESLGIQVVKANDAVGMSMQDHPTICAQPRPTSTTHNPSTTTRTRPGVLRSDLGNGMVVGAACQLQLKKAPTQEERHANMLVRFSSRLEGEGMTDSAHTPRATSTCQALEVTVAPLRGQGKTARRLPA